MKEIIGIVLTARTETSISGQLAQVHTKLKIDEDGCVKIVQDITGTYFNLDTTINEVTVGAGTVYRDAVRVAKRLKKIGYENITLIFNNEKVQIK